MLSLGNMIRKSQPALFWCMRGLSKPKREAIYTLFAFCRHLETVSRSTMPIKEKQDLLGAWREELDNIYDKKIPQTDIGRKIYKNCVRFNIPKEFMFEILNSAALNSESPLLAPDVRIFEQYIHGAAEMPFRIALMIIDPEHLKVGEDLAKNLGRSVLITYVLRDVKDDAKSGRLYIPKEILMQADVKLGTPREIIEDKNFWSARKKMAEQAEKGYIRAERLLTKMDYADVRVLRFLYNLGFCYFEMMQERGWEIISPKPKINLAKRLQIFYHTVFG